MKKVELGKVELKASSHVTKNEGNVVMPASDSDKSDKNGSSDNEESSSDDDLPLFQFKSRGGE